MKGLFINTEQAVCSIHESGLMVYNCIRQSLAFTLDYTEISRNKLGIPANYDFYLFNYHFSTTGWLDTRTIRKLPGWKGTVVLEILPDDPFVYCSPFDFDFYCVLDPSMNFRHKKVFVFPRPLDDYHGDLFRGDHPIPVIGSFGFATKGKGFEHVVEAVNKEFENAVVRINIPHGTYTDPSHQYALELAAHCRSLAKPGIDIRITHEFMSKSELIRWCSENTLNCFLYDRDMPGLAATTDQAITSERPLAVSDNPTFRHIIKYLKPYPAQTLKESIASSAGIVKKIKADWSAQSFCLLFEEMLGQLKKKGSSPSSGNKEVKLGTRERKSFRSKFDKYLLRLVRLYYKSPLYAAFR